VTEASDGRFRIQVLPPGEALQALDAVTNDTLEICHTAAYYYVDKDPTFALATGVPFGPNARLQNAWMIAGGTDLMNEFFAKYNLYALPAGNTGCQMGGWFRKEIKTASDLNGLKMRVGGLAGRVLQKLGVVPRQMPGAEISPALEKEALDAVVWLSPYDDEKLGLTKLAPYYYFPGWWSGGELFDNFINLNKWNSLPAGYRSLLRAASDQANLWMQSKYDANNPPALRRVVIEGARLKPFPPAVLDAGLKSALGLYAELSAANPAFKKVWDSIFAFRNDAYLWWQLAEYSYDTYLIQTRTRT